MHPDLGGTAKSIARAETFAGRAAMPFVLSALHAENRSEARAKFADARNTPLQCPRPVSHSEAPGCGVIAISSR